MDEENKTRAYVHTLIEPDEISKEALDDLRKSAMCEGKRSNPGMLI